MKSILITGCNRGIGLGLVKKITQTNNPSTKVIATCRNPEKAKDLWDIANQTENVTILELDVAKFETHLDFTNKVAEILQDGGLNVLINNAGVAPRSTRIQFVEWEDMMNAFRVNTVGPTMITKAMLPFLKQAAKANDTKPMGPDRAMIMNVTSQLGSITENTNGGIYAYRCSKVALNMVTKSLSVDLKKYDILTTCVHPGWVRTDMGGKNAPLDVDASVLGIIELMIHANASYNGKFFQWDGKQLSW